MCLWDIVFYMPAVLQMPKLHLHVANMIYHWVQFQSLWPWQDREGTKGNFQSWNTEGVTGLGRAGGKIFHFLPSSDCNDVLPLIINLFITFQGSVNFKFGVIYTKEGQTSDDEMYSTGNK